MSENVDIILSGANSFVVKFIAKDLLTDFETMVEMFNKKELQLLVKKLAENAFEVQAIAEKRSAWDIVMHKYMAYSKMIRKDKNGNKYSPVEFSLLRVA